MLDIITYEQTGGVWKRTVTHTESVLDLEMEIATLTAQLADFEEGQKTTFSQAVADAILNYQAQLALLTQ